MEIIFLDSHTLSLNNDISFKPLKSLRNYKGLKLTNEDNIISCCKKAEIIIVNKININRNIIEKLHRLKLIAVIATGYNNIDLEAARDNNIKVANVPNYGSRSVSQYAFCLILNLMTKTYLYDMDVKNGEWPKSRNFGLLKYSTFELYGKTIGIIGFGAIGRCTAKIAEGFGMNIIVYDRKNIPGDWYKTCSLDELLKNSDIISIHCPLNPETRNMIDARAINKMKKTAVLINTARGGLINEKDLADALNSCKIAGAGIDVLENEPPKEDDPILRNVKNLIITPHTAWSTFEARQKMIDITTKNIEAFINEEDYNLVT